MTIKPIEITISAFLIAIPFSAVANQGFFGNFSSNLSTVPLLLSITLLVVSKNFYKTIKSSETSTRLLRIITIGLLTTSVLTIINGLRLEALNYEAYGITPLQRSMRASLAPIFIACIVICAGYSTRFCKVQRLDWCLGLSFWLVTIYTFFQIIFAYYESSIFDQLSSFIEGGRAFPNRSYLQYYQRVNGVTSEPAQFGRTLGMFFLPWLLFPFHKKRSYIMISITIVLMISSGALTSATLLIIFFLWFIITQFRDKHYIGIIIFLLLIFTFNILVLDQFIDKHFVARLSALGENDSFLVRILTASIAVQIIAKNFFIGVGWSNEIFFFPEYMWDHRTIWEVSKNVMEGTSLTARSMFLRLLMYMGIPLFISITIMFTLIARRALKNLPSVDQNRIKIGMILFVTGSIIDGGIITSFFPWASLGLIIASFHSPNRLQRNG